MDSQASGQILNLISNDLGRLEYVKLFIAYIVIGPIQSGVIIYLLITLIGKIKSLTIIIDVLFPKEIILFYSIIDVSVLSGLIIMALVVPTQAVCGKIYDHFR